jgi:ABC-type Fe3+ transport system substrate-binding protein
VNLKDAADPAGYRHPYAVNIQVLVSNPNLANFVPNDIFQLSTPAFKGQLTFDSPDNLGSGALFLASHRKAWGDKKWMTWLQGLKANNTLIASSATGAFQNVLTGERGIGCDSVTDVLSAPSGAPVKANFYSGMPPYRQGLMLTSYAANPYTAQLFMNWALSKAGQTAVASTGRSPAMDLPVPTSVSTVLPKGKTIAPYSSISGFVFNPTPYTKIWDSLWPS